jgi:hypothetical protein
MSSHDDLVEKAKEAVNRVFGDRSVSRTETKESLGDIVSDIEIMLDTLEDD